VAKFVA